MRQTTSLTCLHFCGYALLGLTRDWSRQGGFLLLEQLDCAALKHRKLCRDVLGKRQWMEWGKSHILPPFSHSAHAWQEPAVENIWGPDTMSLCDTITSESISGQSFSSHHLSAQHSFTQPAKNSLSEYFPYHTSLLMNSVQLSGSLQCHEQSTSLCGQEGRSQANCSCRGGQQLFAVP